MPNRYWVGGTGNWDSTTTANWSATSGGPSGASVPTASDDVFIDANSGAVTVTKTTSTSCLTLTFTGYTGTFTINNGITLTVFGTAITLGSGMTFTSGTTGVLSTLGNQTAITITFAGITIPRLTIGKTSVASIQTVTISGTNPTIQNLLVTNGNTNSTTTLAGTPIIITSSLNVNGTGPLTGTLLTFSGTCTISCLQSTSSISNGFTVNAGSSLQMLSTIYVGAGTITFVGNATLNPGTFTLFYPNLASASINSSGVTWYNVSFNVNGGILTLLSNLNISNDFGCLNSTITGAFSINIGGSANLVGSSCTLGSTTIMNLIGTGSLLSATITSGGVININTTNPLGYTLGNATYPTTLLSGTALNLVGTSVAQVYSTTGHTLQLAGGSIISTNNTATGAGIVGGSEIIWGNLAASNNTGQFTYESTFLGNLTSLSANAQFLGAKIKVAGNLSVATLLSGTSTIELFGSTNTTMSAGQYQNNIIVNKSGVGTKVTTAAGTITWGLANRTLTINTAIDFLTNSTTFTLSGTPLTINNSFGSQFFNLTIPAGTTLTLNQTLNVSGTLLCNGSATFTGTHGWTTNGFTCTTASAVITLQNANPTFGSPLAAYNVTGPLILQGTSTTTRITLQASGRANFTGSIATASLPTTSVMTVASLTSGTIQAGMTVSQASGIIPTGLQPFINDRPVINSGGGLSWTLNKALSTVVPSPSGTTTLAAGFKAIFNLTSTGTNVNVGLVTTQDIDSSGGQTILAAISNGDDTATNTALYRTLNWGPLIAPSGSVYYTWVD